MVLLSKIYPDFAGHAQPHINLTKAAVPFVWNEEQEQSLKHFKGALTTATILGHPDYTKPMEIHPDASNYGIGAVLLQRINQVETPLAFTCRTLKNSERNYTITEKECRAVVWALQKLQYIIWGCKILVVTDHHTLCWLLSKKVPAGRLARWATVIQGEQIKIVHKNGKK